MQHVDLRLVASTALAFNSSGVHFRTRRMFCVITALVVAHFGQTALAGNCDEKCLRATMDTYLDAMVAHRPDAISRAPDFRFTENGVEITLADGLWSTAQGPVGYRIYVPDPATQSIAFIGSVHERGKQLFFAVRLRVSDGKISDAETEVSRGTRFRAPPNAVARTSFAELTQPADRLPRKELIDITNRYFDALQEGDGDLAPFHPDCLRIENGAHTTGKRGPNGEPPESCYQNIENIAPLSDLIHRRVAAVDETRNMVMWVFDFSMPGTDSARLTAWKKKVGPARAAMLEDTVRPSSGPAFELFRVREGRIAEIEAVFYGHRPPFGFGTGWDTPGKDRAPASR